MKSAARGCTATSPLRGGRKRKQTGQAVVELALLLPVFMMLALGLFWAGRAFTIYEAITRAAREGARTATAPSCALCGNTFYDQTYIKTNVINPALKVAGLDPAQVQNFTFQQGVVLNPTSNPTEVGTVVSFTYPFQFYLPFTSLNLTQVNIFTQVQMRSE
ncbi:MAG TPA: TadE family protein [Terriglobales bacterium]|nr:TadE family protein [Terriglobales bacterium]